MTDHGLALVLVVSLVACLAAGAAPATSAPAPQKRSNATVARAERVARAQTEDLKDHASVAGAELTKQEYREAAASANVMKRKDGFNEACGAAYCDDLIHYKPELMRESQFLDQCLAAHHEWEHATDYSLECPHQATDDCGGVECPVNANARRHRQLLDLLEHTRRMIEKRRAKASQRQAELYVKDSAESKKAKAEQAADVSAGHEQRRMAKSLERAIDVKSYQREKRNSMRVKTRCKDGSVVGNVYAKGGKERAPDCTKTPVRVSDVIPEQGYLRTQRPGR